MTYARSGTCRAGRRCVGGFVRDCQTQHNAETNLAPLRRGFFVEVACTLSQASPVDDDQQNLAPLPGGAFVCEIPCAVQPTASRAR